VTVTVSALFLRGRFEAWTPALACVAFAFLVRPVAAEQGANILAQASSGPLRCEIQRNDKDSMVELTGIAEGARPLAGHSSFVVTKSGSSGSSNVNQGQHFSVKTDEQAIVGRATINLDSGGRVAVDLRLQSDDGIECHTQASLER
jgi:hypothetical protein